MIIVALETAVDRLVLCQRAYDALQESSSDPRAFAANWLDYLVQWKGVYTKVQQAAKANSSEIQWFGKVNKERRGDPLLRYLFEARNDGEHGIRSSIKHGASCVTLAPTDEGASIAAILPGPGGGMRFVDEKGRESATVTEFVPGEAELQKVSERDSTRKVPPPINHLGRPIEPKPLIVAELGLSWIDSVVFTARAMHEVKHGH